MVNVFEDAPVVPLPKKVKSKKKIIKKMIKIAELENLACFWYVKQRVDEKYDLLKEDIKKIQKRLFIELGMKARKRPDNFDAEEGFATALMQLRIKSSAIELSDEQTSLFDHYGIHLEKINSHKHKAVINQKYYDNAEIMNILVDALNIPGIPKDIIVLEEIPSLYKVDDDLIEDILSLEDEVVIAELIDLVVSFAISNMDIHGQHHEAFQRVVAEFYADGELSELSDSV